MSNKIETFQVLFMKRNARKRGPTSSEQQNDLVEEIAHDLTELNLQWNERLVPLLTSLPNGTEGSPSLAVDAFANGLDGKTMFTDSDATVSTETQYWNTAASRPRTLKEQITDIYTQMTLLREELEGQIGATLLTAAQISIEDDAALYVSNNVEDALAEVMAKANLGLESGSDLSSVEEHILPAQDDTFDLGSPTFRWRDLYLGPASLKVVSKITDGGGYSNKTFHFNIDPTTNKLQIMDGATPVAEFDAAGGASFPAGGGGGSEAFGSDLSAPDDTVYVDSAGEVGIGTLTPSAKLHIIGNVLAVAQVSGNHGGDFTGNLAGHGVRGVGGATGSGGLFTSVGAHAVVGVAGGGNNWGGSFAGFGSGLGVKGTGGGTSGVGVSGQGGSPNGIGVVGVGLGSGAGGHFTGGSTAASGIIAIPGAGGLAGSFMGAIEASEVRVDTNFKLHISTVVPRISFDVANGDYLEFNRTTNEYLWRAGGSDRIILAPSGLLAAVDTGVVLGDATHRWSDLQTYAARVHTTLTFNSIDHHSGNMVIGEVGLQSEESAFGINFEGGLNNQFTFDNNAGERFIFRLDNNDEMSIKTTGVIINRGLTVGMPISSTIVDDTIILNDTNCRIRNDGEFVEFVGDFSNDDLIRFDRNTTTWNFQINGAQQLYMEDGFLHLQQEGFASILFGDQGLGISDDGNPNIFFDESVDYLQYNRDEDKYQFVVSGEEIAGFGDGGVLSLREVTSHPASGINEGHIYVFNDKSLRYKDEGNKVVSLSAQEVNSFHHAFGNSGLNTYYVPWLTQSSWSTGSLAINLLHAIPFVNGNEDRSVDQLSIFVITPQVGNAVMGIYTNKSSKDLYPDQLVATSATISTNTSNQVNSTISATLKAGQLYWCVWNASATPVLRVPSSSAITGILGVDPVNTTNFGRIQVAHTYTGALPATYPAGATLQASFAPGIYFRYTNA